MSDKHEGISKIGKGGTHEDRELKQDLDWRYKSALSKKNDPNRGKKSKSKLNKLGMGSHRWGKYTDRIDNLATDNLDQGTTKIVTKRTSGKQVVGYRESSFLAKDDEIEWIVLSQTDYESQLIIGLPRKYHPRKLVKSNNKIFLDPDKFVDLVKAQEKHNDVKLVISYERSRAVAKTGNLNVLVQNPKNPYHETARSSDIAEDQDWTGRYRRGSRDRGKRGA